STTSSLRSSVPWRRTRSPALPAPPSRTWRGFAAEWASGFARTTGRSWRRGTTGGVRWPVRWRARPGCCRGRPGPSPPPGPGGGLRAGRPRRVLPAASPTAGGLLDPPVVPAGGDGDTVQAADFVPTAGFELSLTSVARYVFDLGDWERSAWIVPLGVSGHPG